MKKMYRNALVAAALFFTAGSYAQTVKLVLAKGQKFQVTTVAKVNTTANVMGQDMDNTADNTTVNTIEVKDTRPGETDLASTITRLTANVSMMGQDMSYDSEKKDNSGPMADELSKTVNVPKNITIDDKGKVIKEDKTKEAAGNVLMMGANSDAGLPIIRESLIGRELKPGASWLDSTIANADKIKSKTVGTYSIKSIEGNTAILQFDGVQTVSGVFEQAGQEMNMTGTNKMKVEVKMDVTTGIILESVANIEGSSTVEAMGMSIPVTLKSTVTTTAKAL